MRITIDQLANSPISRLNWLLTRYTLLITYYCILRDTIHEIRDMYLESFVKKNKIIFKKKKDFLNGCRIKKIVFYFYLNMV